MVILDTCALIEAVKPNPSFSPHVLDNIESGAIILSISFAEIACKVKLGKLDMSTSPKNLYQQFSEINAVDIVNIGVNEWLDSIDLQWEENKDPADRVITAFAIKSKLSIVTTDLKIKKFYDRTMW